MKRKYTLMLLTGVVMLSFLGKGEVFAADTKHAILNEARIRFNEGSVQTIQCYNIDGSNYVRAREITNRLDMEMETKE